MPHSCAVFGRICNRCTGFVAITTQPEREMSASACTRSMPGWICENLTGHSGCDWGSPPLNTSLNQLISKQEQKVVCQKINEIKMHPFLSPFSSFIVLGLTLFMVALWNRADHYIFILFMVVLWNRADHYIFALWFLLSIYLLFLPRLISAVADWMSAILPHTVWP